MLALARATTTKMHAWPCHVACKYLPQLGCAVRENHVGMHAVAAAGFAPVVHRFPCVYMCTSDKSVECQREGSV